MLHAAHYPTLPRNSLKDGLLPRDWVIWNAVLPTYVRRLTRFDRLA